jgi:hypothetical protein
MSPTKILLNQIRSIKKARDRCMKEHTRSKNIQKREALQYACEALTYTEFKLEVELESLLSHHDNGQNSN